ncbi:uncharacterized protein LOC113128021 isoform X2 [Mastacembelus armatus]|uniref:uncharacterized protein LOC113128021 isoform X2 n=1 Tax=Mastacembelus armatus TaxID=205130 RepID=UPI000E4633E9|nr:uncharacterized protein LOC113128021 isoform X2 [Mastacembelus armatus]
MANKHPRRRRSEQQKARKRIYEQARAKSRVNIGKAFQRWRKLRENKGLKNDTEVALFLLDSYLRTKSESQSEQTSLERTSSTETYSPNEAEQEMCAATSVQSPENGKELEKKDAADQSPEDQDAVNPTSQAENKDNRETEDEDEEFSTSLSVGDGHYLVDLGSSSEFIVDEECILQLFKSCRKCNRRCNVRKHVKGLKLVIYQACRFCHSRCKWTNLPDNEDNKDDSDFTINGKHATHGQNSKAASPSSNSSS